MNREVDSKGTSKITNLWFSKRSRLMVER